MGFGKYTVTCTHFYSITEHSLVTQNKPCASPVQRLLLPKLVTAFHLFYVSIILPFLGCHINWTIQHVAFSDYFFILSIMHSRFIHVGHLGGSVGEISAFGSCPDPRVLESSPPSGSLLSGKSASPSALPALMISLSCSLSLSQIKNK